MPGLPIFKAGIIAFDLFTLWFLFRQRSIATGREAPPFAIPEHFHADGTVIFSELYHSTNNPPG